MNLSLFPTLVVHSGSVMSQSNMEDRGRGPDLCVSVTSLNTKTLRCYKTVNLVTPTGINKEIRLKDFHLKDPVFDYKLNFRKQT